MADEDLDTQSCASYGDFAVRADKIVYKSSNKLGSTHKDRRCEQGVWRTICRIPKVKDILSIFFARPAAKGVHGL